MLATTVVPLGMGESLIEIGTHKGKTIGDVTKMDDVGCRYSLLVVDDEMQFRFVEPPHAPFAPAN